MTEGRLHSMVRLNPGLLELYTTIGGYSGAELDAVFGDVHDVPPHGTALLVIDMYQMVFGDGPFSCGDAAAMASPKAEKILRAARTAGIPVVHSTGEDRPEARPLEATLMNTGSRGRNELRHDYAPQPGFEPQAGEVVVYKSAASAFFETRLRTFLQSKRITSIVVVGESTSGCVRASVVDAYSSGFNVYLPFDAVFDRHPASHAASLYDMGLKYARVVNSEAVAQSLMGLQGEGL